MIRRNKLSIFLIAVVMMLTIYYINTPSDFSTSVDDIPKTSSIARHPAFAEERFLLLEERTAHLESLAVSIVSSDNQEVLLSEYEYYQDLTEKEVAVENEIKLMGYEDCFCEMNIDDTQASIKIKLLADSFTKNEFIEIKSAIQETYPESQVNISYIVK